MPKPRLVVCNRVGRGGRAGILCRQSLSIKPGEKRRHANSDHAGRDASAVARNTGRKVVSLNPACLAEGTTISKNAHRLVIGLHKPLELLARRTLGRGVAGMCALRRRRRIDRPIGGTSWLPNRNAGGAAQRLGGSQGQTR